MSKKSGALTLEEVRRSPKLGDQVFQISDFMSSDEVTEVRRNNAIGKKKRRPYDTVDAFVAEMIARFGYDVYCAWNKDELSEELVNKMMVAERAREKAQLLELEGIIIAMVGACVKKEEGQPAPKGPKTAIKIFKRVAKMARGEING